MDSISLRSVFRARFLRRQILSGKLRFRRTRPAEFRLQFNEGFRWGGSHPIHVWGGQSIGTDVGRRTHYSCKLEQLDIKLENQITNNFVLLHLLTGFMGYQNPSCISTIKKKNFSKNITAFISVGNVRYIAL